MRAQRLLKKLEKQVETNPRPDYLAKIATLREVRLVLAAR